MPVKFLIIVSNTSRSLCYLKNLKKNNLPPETIIYLDDLSNNYFSKSLKKNKFFLTLHT